MNQRVTLEISLLHAFVQPLLHLGAIILVDLDNFYAFDVSQLVQNQVEEMGRSARKETNHRCFRMA